MGTQRDALDWLMLLALVLLNPVAILEGAAARIRPTLALLVDTSRSMLAEDVPPSRIKAAQAALEAAATAEPPLAKREIPELPVPPDSPDWRDVLQRAFLTNGDLEAAYFFLDKIRNGG